MEAPDPSPSLQPDPPPVRRSRIATFLALADQRAEAARDTVRSLLTRHRSLWLVVLLLLMPIVTAWALASFIGGASQRLVYQAEVGRFGPISTLAWSDDGRYAAAGSHAGEIVIWDSASRAAVARLRSNQPGTIMALRVLAQRDANEIEVFARSVELPRGPTAATAQTQPATADAGLVVVEKWTVRPGTTGPQRPTQTEGRNEVEPSSGRHLMIGVRTGQPGDIVSITQVSWIPSGAEASGARLDRASIVIADERDIKYVGLESGAIQRRDLFAQPTNPTATPVVQALDRVPVTALAKWPTGDAMLAGGADGTVRRVQMGPSRLLSADWAEKPANYVELRGHTSKVTGASFSPDASRILTFSYDDTARLWNAATGKHLVTLRGHENLVNSAVFSRDGTRVLTSSHDMTARLWDATSGKELTVLRGHESNVYSGVFSPDGTQVLTASYDKTARLWDAAVGKELVVLRGHEDSVGSAVFSPNGAQVMTTSNDNTARLWEAATGKELATLRHGGRVNSAVFSPNGTLILTASSDSTARLWDLASGKELAVFRHEARVNSAVFSNDGTRVLTASSDKTARLWESATGKQLAALHHEKVVYSAIFSPDGRRVLTVCADSAARLWDAATGNQLIVLSGHENIEENTGFSPDGRWVLTASTDTTARVWFVGDRPIAHTARVVGLHVLQSQADQAFWSIAEDGDGALWTGQDTGRRQATIRHGDTITASGLLDNQRLLYTAGFDGSVRLWDSRSGRSYARLGGHGAPILHATGDPRGEHLLVGDATGRVRLVDVARAAFIDRLRFWQRIPSWVDDVRIWVESLFAASPPPRAS